MLEDIKVINDETKLDKQETRLLGASTDNDDLYVKEIIVEGPLNNAVTNNANADDNAGKKQVIFTPDIDGKVNVGQFVRDVKVRNYDFTDPEGGDHSYEDWTSVVDEVKDDEGKVIGFDAKINMAKYIKSPTDATKDGYLYGWSDESNSSVYHTTWKNNVVEYDENGYVYENTDTTINNKEDRKLVNTKDFKAQIAECVKDVLIGTESCVDDNKKANIPVLQSKGGNYGTTKLDSSEKYLTINTSSDTKGKEEYCLSVVQASVTDQGITSGLITDNNIISIGNTLNAFGLKHSAIVNLEMGTSSTAQGSLIANMTGTGLTENDNVIIDIDTSNSENRKSAKVSEYSKLAYADIVKGTISVNNVNSDIIYLRFFTWDNSKVDLTSMPSLVVMW